MTWEGIYGVAVDVSSSLIIPASPFSAPSSSILAPASSTSTSRFGDGGKPPARRSVVLASFLLGGLPVGCRDHGDPGRQSPIRCWAKAGYERNAAGGLSRRGRPSARSFAAVLAPRPF